MSPEQRLPPDPGGVFASNAHRRVLGALRAPHEDDGLIALDPGPDVKRGGSLRERVANDAHMPVEASVDTVLAELEQEGLVERAGRHLRMTNKGFDALNGPNNPEPPPMSEAQVLSLHEAGEIDDDAVAAWRQAVGGSE